MRGQLATTLVLAIAAWISAPATANAKVRVAVPEFKVDGDGTPALSLQLQDGFVLGLVRAGIQVLDPVDVSRRLEATPELGGCDSSACLKNIGRLLAVTHVLRVKVDVAGNSYKMVARLFSTEGSAPAALPISTKSRSCDVCTVAEAREYMLKLADAVKPDLLDVAPPAMPPLLPTPPAPAPSLIPPLVAAMGGALAVGIGIALFATMPECQATGVPTCDDNRLRSAVAGALIGAGTVTSIVGTSLTISRSRGSVGGVNAGPATVTSVAFAVAF
ncbi:MAG: hypothetical protein H7X95_06770 [Deltaproteobacteria bacterium]|nr:hypothetical protein [Deltaproteobacteria bacterium]